MENGPVQRAGKDSELDLEARIARLTAGQRACLDLVDDHATSKEIALALGISRHTVDARLRQAMQVLGVTSRREAAIIWRASNAALEAGRPAVAPRAGLADGYQPFAYQPSRVETPAGTADEAGHEPAFDPVDDPASEDDGGPAFRPAGLFGSPPRIPAHGQARQGDHGQRSEVADAASMAWPGPVDANHSLRLWGGANDLTVPQRIAGILIVTILAMLAFGLLLSGIAALTQLRT